MNKENIEERINAVKCLYPDVVFNWRELSDEAFVIIMRGGIHAEDPTAYMNGAVSTLVQHELHNQFIEEFLDNPWIRIIIFGFNNIEFK